MTRPGTAAELPGSAARSSRAMSPRRRVGLRPILGTSASAAGRGTAGASAAGRGLDSPLPHPPVLWRSKFSDDVASRLVSWSNPDGSINNSELELAGVIGHNDILANCCNIQEVTTATGTDNTAAHSWATKGAVSSTGPSSYLLRLKSMHQRAHRYQLRTFYIPGPYNTMADDCSRLWHLSDKELLEYFDRTYPQAVPWQIRHLSPAMQESLNAALLCTRAPPDTLDEVLRPVDESDDGFPQGWELPVSAASHGFRQRLYEQFALRPKSWTDRRPTPRQR